MILEIQLGEHVIVRVDDDLTERMTPEQCEDYLTRMRRTAVAAYEGLPDEPVDALADPDDERRP